MATNEIKSKFATRAEITITLASLASSTTTVGRQSTIVNNATTKYNLIHLLVKITSGVSTGGTFAAGFAYIYLLKSDGTLRTDAAGASDAALTTVNALPIGAVKLSASGTAYIADFWIADPGLEWGIAVVHNTVANLDSTAGNHSVFFVGDNPDIQAAA